MALSLAALPSLRKQRLLTEFASIKHNPPQGVFMSLTPDDPTLWSGVMFIRKGPYASVILRFQVSFPPGYPSLPPLITFSTDLFHPLITPLTTYMYTTDIQDSGTVSATDEERLPPGGFSLRHGFPAWFGRNRRRASSRQVSGTHGPQTPAKSGSHGSAQNTPESLGSSGSTPGRVDGWKYDSISVFDVLRYVRTTFDNEEVLDALPLEAAGNPGAWHAWRAHRLELGKLPPEKAQTNDETSGSWNWEGVWEVRVNQGLQNCLSEQMLYGNSVGDDLIRFLNMDEEQLDKVKESLEQVATLV